MNIRKINKGDKFQFTIVIFLSVIFYCKDIFADNEVVFKSNFETFIQHLNDTGISWGGDFPELNNLGCTSNIMSVQDCDYGRDLDFPSNIDGNAGFSLTKIDANGNSLDVSALEWACVKDNVTGLIWEVKTNDGGIHDKDNTYRWGGLTAIGRNHPDREGVYYDDWNPLVAGSNSENLCGLNHWKVPTIVELSSITDMGRTHPSIDRGFFPNTILFSYWTASPVPLTSVSGHSVWSISFVVARDTAVFHDREYFVRLVHRSP